MSSFDELDQEIDHEMGWSKGKKKPGSARRRPGYWQALLLTARVSSPLWRGVKAVCRPIAKVLLFPIISPMGYSKRFNDYGDIMIVKRSFGWRVADAVITRVLLAPVILAIFLVAVVYANTHPRTLHAISTPDGLGMYFKRVSVVTVDNERLTGWFIPPMRADDVAFDPEGTLAQKWPAVVLCHGLGATNDQYLPLAQELHNAGFGVLMLDTRGQGESDTAAVTYGLRERLDVLAGVKFLRETNYVDPSKVCVVGHDIGAMAVLQAATLDSSIAAVVADGLWPGFEERALDIFGRPSLAMSGGDGGHLPTEWLAPLYSMAFEIAVRDRVSQLDPDFVVKNIHTQPVLFVSREGPEYTGLQDLLTLASNTGSHHEVMVSTGEWEKKVCECVVRSTPGKGAKARGTEEIENLLKSRVPAK